MTQSLTGSLASGREDDKYPGMWRLLTSIVAIWAASVGVASGGERHHAIAMHGKPALAKDFKHFPYVNANAPKGGRLTFGQRGTFDSLNPFIPKGNSVGGMRGLVFESLLARSSDEPFTLYALIAKSIEVAPDRASWITFHIDPDAKWSDGRPLTSDDVIFSHDILRRKGRPYLRSHYNKVEKIERFGARSLKFHFKTSGDREIPLIIGLMPILPKHATNIETFDRTSLTPLIGSGPYKVAKVEPGTSISFRRDPSYWAADRPSRRGMHNFDELRVLYYRDASAVFEAFKTGTVDLRKESNPARWINGYDFPAMRDGKVRQLKFKTGRPAGMSALIFNTRRKKFEDIRVRRALALAFDGPDINKSLFHGRFVRSQSFFARSGLASTGVVADAREMALLKPFPKAVSADILSGAWRLADGRTSERQRLKRAYDLLRSAGYELKARRLVHSKSGQALSFEFLISSTAQERIALTFAKSLKRLGIGVSVRKVESSQYWSRIGQFDFDMMQWHYSASLSPGNEQINRWSSTHAGIERSLNYAGVKNPAVDAMIKHMLVATDREDFEAAVRAFDRALLSGNYLIPLFHVPEEWYAAWTHLDFPKRPPLLGTNSAFWWHKGAK